jgi:hypothetical protein
MALDGGERRCGLDPFEPDAVGEGPEGGGGEGGWLETMRCGGCGWC